MLEMLSQALRVIDVFSGAGGLSLGFQNAGDGKIYRHVWAVDNDSDSINSYNHHFGNYGVCADLELVIEAHKKGEQVVPQADVVVGGPPCQGFSALNKHRKGDSRRALWSLYLEIVAISGAHTFVMENVPSLLKSDEYSQIKEQSKQMGFCVHSLTLNSADFGVAQTRVRAIIVGSKIADPRFLSLTPTHYDRSKGRLSKKSGQLTLDESLEPWTSVGDVIADLPLEAPLVEKIDQSGLLGLHFGRQPTELSLQRYRCVPPGGDRRDLPEELLPPCWKNRSGGTEVFGRLHWEKPSVTIRTEFWKPEKGRYLHPFADRPITHREAARLQSFPDDFVFVGNRSSIGRQIGNAVPPVLAEHIGNAVARLLSESVLQCFDSVAVNEITSPILSSRIC